MPDPGEIARMLREGVPAMVASSETSSKTEKTAPAAALPSRIEDVIALVEEQKPLLAGHLHDCCALVSIASPDIELRLTSPWHFGDFRRDLEQALNAATGARWTVRLAETGGEPTLLEQQRKRMGEERAAVLETPVVKAALDAFPEADFDRLEQWSAER